MKYLLIILILLTGCKQTMVLKDNLVDNNNRTNEIANAFTRLAAALAKDSPENVGLAVAAAEAERISQRPLPSDIELPPLIPPQVVSGGMSLLQQAGLGGGGLGTILLGVAGYMYRKQKGHARALGTMDKNESKKYMQDKGLS